MATICDLWMKKVMINELSLLPFFYGTLTFVIPAPNRIIALAGGSSLTLRSPGIRRVLYCVT